MGTLSANELLGKERPWEGNCILRFPEDFDIDIVNDDSTMEFKYNDQTRTTTFHINDKSYPCEIVQAPGPLDVSVSKDNRAFFKSADILHYCLVDGAKLPERPPKEAKKWTAEEHIEAIEEAKKLMARKPMVFVEESEVEETVYFQRLKESPESIWTLEKPSKGLMVVKEDKNDE